MRQTGREDTKCKEKPCMLSLSPCKQGISMRKKRLELSRPCDHRHLKPARLPIPPLPHVFNCVSLFSSQTLYYHFIFKVSTAFFVFSIFFITQLLLPSYQSRSCQQGSMGEAASESSHRHKAGVYSHQKEPFRYNRSERFLRVFTFIRNCSEPVLNSYASGDASHPESPDAT